MSDVATQLSRDELLAVYMQAKTSGEKAEVAIDACNKLLELEPENYRFYHLRAEKYLQLGIKEEYHLSNDTTFDEFFLKLNVYAAYEQDLIISDRHAVSLQSAKEFYKKAMEDELMCLGKAMQLASDENPMDVLAFAYYKLGQRNKALQTGIAAANEGASPYSMCIIPLLLYRPLSLTILDLFHSWVEGWLNFFRGRNVNLAYSIANTMWAIFWFVQCSLNPFYFNILTPYINKYVMHWLYLLFGRWCPCVGPHPFYALTVQTSTILPSGQYWKLLTNVFLHEGLLNLWITLGFLKYHGNKLVENIGNFKFFVIFFLSAIISSAVSSMFLPSDRIALGASGAAFGVMIASIISEASKFEHSKESGVFWCLCFLLTELVLAYLNISNAKYDEILQFIVILIISGNFTASEVMDVRKGSAIMVIWHLFNNVLFQDNINHWAQFAGGMTGFILAGGILGTSLLISNGLMGSQTKVYINGYKDYTSGKVINSIEFNGKSCYHVKVMTKGKSNEDCSEKNITVLIEASHLKFTRQSAVEGLMTCAMVGAVLAIFYGLCWQAYKEDVYAEKLLPNVDIFDSLEEKFKWLDFGESLGVAYGLGNHPLEWITLEKRA